MILSEEQYQTMMIAAIPLLTWMDENCRHPHTTIIVTEQSVELLEGVAMHGGLSREER